MGYFMSLDDVISFLSNSIEDIQNTIRAIDAKIGFLIAILMIPLAYLSNIINLIISIIQRDSSCILLIFIYFCIVLFIITWLLAILSSIIAITAIANPRKQIDKGEKCKGSFYAGGLFQLTIMDLFFYRKSKKSSISLTNQVLSLPRNKTEIVKELTFEQMKLAYIRDIKILRQRWAFRFSLMTYSVGLLLMLFARITSL